MKAIREDRWTQVHLEYRDLAERCRTAAQSRIFDWRSEASRRGFFEELAAACLTFRDAAWAADLYPVISHGGLGISTTSDDFNGLFHREVWLACDKDCHPIARFRDGFRRTTVRQEVLPDLSETTLMTLAEWVRGRSQQGAG